jgi:hypothetical protein
MVQRRSQDTQRRLNALLPAPVRGDVQARDRAAVLRRTQEREQARKLLAFLATSAAREQFLASGVE